ncbi:NUDIX hydrolase [Candidatus Falkowbacteria bacterium]|nr:NUDIX hydrolase [Candidatus Falkowbacteria bacterium]
MWKKLSSKEIFNHPRLTLIEDEVLLPSGIKTTYLRFKDSADCSVTIIAKRPDGKILLQREYSYPPDKYLLQFPGGDVVAGESPEIGANRELAEEMGLKGNTLKLLGSYLMSNRRSAKMMHVYVATDLKEFSLDADPEEDIEALWFDEAEIADMIKCREIINAHTLASWGMYRSQ